LKNERTYQPNDQTTLDHPENRNPAGKGYPAGKRPPRPTGFWKSGAILISRQSKKENPGT
ncbi:MAG: hypothetical protein EA359_14005, partial [Balneolaceae bacterium]